MFQPSSSAHMRLAMPRLNCHDLDVVVQNAFTGQEPTVVVVASQSGTIEGQSSSRLPADILSFCIYQKYCSPRPPLFFNVNHHRNHRHRTHRETLLLLLQHLPFRFLPRPCLLHPAMRDPDIPSSSAVGPSSGKELSSVTVLGGTNHNSGIALRRDDLPFDEELSAPRPLRPPPALQLPKTSRITKSEAHSIRKHNANSQRLDRTRRVFAPFAPKLPKGNTAILNCETDKARFQRWCQNCNQVRNQRLRSSIWFQYSCQTN